MKGEIRGLSVRNEQSVVKRQSAGETRHKMKLEMMNLDSADGYVGAVYTKAVSTYDYQA